MSDETLPGFLGPVRPWGETGCAHSEHDGDWNNTCGLPGAWHIMWTDSGECSVCCHKHAVECPFVKKAFQVHKLLPDCTMPGARWYKEEGVCRWEPDITDEPPMRKAAKELVLV